ncbi:MAG: hypothetical protein COU27_01075 [Candidatus Levybacteria bacterium CG10_big_fil_rev_8_21_14_0_10_36_7]|nr:MAG: hypothetical protein COU27_01075 [Candidatus Levybacteria bacterium CG10_big_fil_rev_8_21_14_0_10_36_7]
MQNIVNIRNGRLLEPFFQEYCKNKFNITTFASAEEIEVKIKSYKEEWSKYESLFFDTLERIMGLKLKRNILDCYIVSATNRDMSAPLVIRSRYTPDEFVDILIHELLHVIFVENNCMHKNVTDNTTTNNHISLFGFLSFFFTEIIKDKDRLERMKQLKSNEINNAYIKAWEIVDHVGYVEAMSYLKKQKLCEN